jgi:hypothetical protein
MRKPERSMAWSSINKMCRGEVVGMRAIKPDGCSAGKTFAAHQSKWTGGERIYWRHIPLIITPIQSLRGVIQLAQALGEKATARWPFHLGDQHLGQYQHLY